MTFVYILECSDGSFYTGYTVDLGQRLAKHNEGKASKYTRSRLPVKCVYYEELKDKSQALKREMQIKKMKKEEKIKLVEDWISSAHLGK